MTRSERRKKSRARATASELCATCCTRRVGRGYKTCSVCRGAATERSAKRRLGAPETRGRNRWNTIGRTRRRLAKVLTAFARSIIGGDGKPRFPDAVYEPKRLSPMRLAGKARVWEDAHSWEAFAEDGSGGPSLYSYSTMNECCRGVVAIGPRFDGEVAAL